MLQPSKNPLEILTEKPNPQLFTNLYQSAKFVFHPVFTRCSRFFTRFSLGFDHAWFSPGFHQVFTRFSFGFHQVVHPVFTRFSPGFHEGFHIGFHIAFLRRFFTQVFGEPFALFSHRLPCRLSSGCHVGCHQLLPGWGVISYRSAPAFYAHLGYIERRVWFAIGFACTASSMSGAHPRVNVRCTLWRRLAPMAPLSQQHITQP